MGLAFYFVVNFRGAFVFPADFLFPSPFFSPLSFSVARNTNSEMVLAVSFVHYLGVLFSSSSSLIFRVIFLLLYEF